MTNGNFFRTIRDFLKTETIKNHFKNLLIKKQKINMLNKLIKFIYRFTFLRKNKLDSQTFQKVVSKQEKKNNTLTLKLKTKLKKNFTATLDWLQKSRDIIIIVVFLNAAITNFRILSATNNRIADQNQAISRVESRMTDVEKKIGETKSEIKATKVEVNNIPQKIGKKSFLARIPEIITVRDLVWGSYHTYQWVRSSIKEQYQKQILSEYEKTVEKKDQTLAEKEEQIEKLRSDKKFVIESWKLQKNLKKIQEYPSLEIEPDTFSSMLDGLDLDQILTESSDKNLKKFTSVTIKLPSTNSESIRQLRISPYSNLVEEESGLTSKSMPDIEIKPESQISSEITNEVKPKSNILSRIRRRLKRFDQGAANFLNKILNNDRIKINLKVQITEPSDGKLNDEKSEAEVLSKTKNETQEEQELKYVTRIRVQNFSGSKNYLTSTTDLSMDEIDQAKTVKDLKLLGPYSSFVSDTTTMNTEFGKKNEDGTITPISDKEMNDIILRRKSIKKEQGKDFTDKSKKIDSEKNKDD